MVPSLALLFHLIDWADGGKSEYSVSLNSVELAIKWSAFLEAHARKVYAGAIEPQVVSAHAIVAKISQKKIHSGMSLREIYRHHWANLDTSTKLESATSLLSDLGWLRVKETTTHAGGQSDTIELHPELE